MPMAAFQAHTNVQPLQELLSLDPRSFRRLCSEMWDLLPQRPWRWATNRSRNFLFSRERTVPSLHTCRFTSPSSHGTCQVCTESPVWPCRVLSTPWLAPTPFLLCLASHSRLPHLSLHLPACHLPSSLVLRLPWPSHSHSTPWTESDIWCGTSVKNWQFQASTELVTLFWLLPLSSEPTWPSSDASRCLIYYTNSTWYREFAIIIFVLHLKSVFPLSFAMTVSFVNLLTPTHAEELSPLYWQRFKSSVLTCLQSSRSAFRRLPWQKLLQLTLMILLALSYGVFFLSVFGIIAFPWWASVYLVMWCGFLVVMSFYWDITMFALHSKNWTAWMPSWSHNSTRLLVFAHEMIVSWVSIIRFKNKINMVS